MRYLLLLLFLPIVMFSQITSSTFEGSVKLDGEYLKNSKIVLIHNPTNFEFSTITDKYGRFSLDNLDVGGPYTLLVFNLNELIYIRKNIYLYLGENEFFSIKL